MVKLLEYKYLQSCNRKLFSISVMCAVLVYCVYVVSFQGEVGKEILRIITCPFNLNWHIDTEESTSQRFATCCRLSCVCFIICPGGGNRIYYYPAQRLAHWHNSPLNIEPRSRRCNYIGYNEASARVSGDTRGWWLSRMQWPSVLTSPPWSLIPSSWDSLENCITLRSDQRGLAITRVYTSHMWYTRLILSSKVIIHFFLCCRIGSKNRADLYNRACFVLPLRYENWYHQIFRVENSIWKKIKILHFNILSCFSS